jgi:hypothetical protein
MSRLSMSRVALTIAAPVLVAGLLAMVSAPKRIAVSGVSSMKYSQQHLSAVADASGPVLFLNESKGNNRSTGETEYMADAEVTNREIANLTQGNGSHEGYITFAKGADTTVSSWRGKVITTMGPDRKPATRFEGTWSKVRGTGKYQGVPGRGTYSGKMNSPTEFTIEWKGELELSRSASR